MVLRGITPLQAAPAAWLDAGTPGLPLLTGRMDEFIGLPGIVSHTTRRFGECV
jgi:hypothetical protein